MPLGSPAFCVRCAEGDWVTTTLLVWKTFPRWEAGARILRVACLCEGKHRKVANILILIIEQKHHFMHFSISLSAYAIPGCYMFPLALVKVPCNVERTGDCFQSEGIKTF